MFSEISKILEAKSHIINDILIENIYFDSREIFYSDHSLFITLQGSRDGNDFILDAYEKGIKHFILTKIIQNLPDDVNYILVNDGIKALQKLAEYHRKKFPIPIIAITGSNGKTILKEWLSIIFSSRYKIVKSPKSYNSQIGVPLSVLQIRSSHEIGIFEAGISMPYEMNSLEKILQPSTGVLTHLGDAHQEHFDSFEQKLNEKLVLFQNCKKIYAVINNETTLNLVKEKYNFAITLSKSLRTTYNYKFEDNKLILQKNQSSFTFDVPFYDEANLENLALCLMIALENNFSTEFLQNQIYLLPTLPMRLELISDNQEFTFIIDSWSTDFESLRHALYFFNQIHSFPKKKIILTDFENLKLNSELFQYILKNYSTEQLYLIGNKFEPLIPKYQVFQNTDDFLKRLKWEDFVNSTILLKGSRIYALERVYYFLNLKASTTYFKINLLQLKKNFSIYKNLLKKNTQIMVMLKADSYGSGTWEIAKTLEGLANYFGVAFTVEGIQLRKKGILTPIMVMNPDLNSLHLLEKYQLEPAIGSFDLLNQLSKFSVSDFLNIHLEIETGMNRLGFSINDLSKILLYLKNSKLRLVSIFTHLAAADNPLHDDFTLHQIHTFQKAIDFFHSHNYFPFCHCLNTSGIERFPKYQMDMVRLGIGLYGISQNQKDVHEIGKMYSKITRIHSINKGESVGYDRSYIAQNDMTIATIPVGYADGLKRNLSNGKWSFKIHHNLCPIIGKICMDMTMIDVTNVPNAKVGDEVLIFGEEPLNINEMAKAANTIPYECLVSIPPRVKRVFVEE